MKRTNIVCIDNITIEDLPTITILLLKGVDIILITANTYIDPLKIRSRIIKICNILGLNKPLIYIGSLYTSKDEKLFKNNNIINRNLTICSLSSKISIFENQIPEIDNMKLEDNNEVYQYNINYLNDIYNIIVSSDKTSILSLCSMTDIEKLLNLLEVNKKLEKIDKIFQLGGILEKELNNNAPPEKNIYIDPIAAYNCLEKYSQIIYWIPRSSFNNLSTPINIFHHNETTKWMCDLLNKYGRKYDNDSLKLTSLYCSMLLYDEKIVKIGTYKINIGRYFQISKENDEKFSKIVCSYSKNLGRMKLDEKHGHKAKIIVSFLKNNVNYNIEKIIFDKIDNGDDNDSNDEFNNNDDKLDKNEANCDKMQYEDISSEIENDQNDYSESFIKNHYEIKNETIIKENDKNHDKKDFEEIKKNHSEGMDENNEKIFNTNENTIHKTDNNENKDPKLNKNKDESLVKSIWNKMFSNT